MMLKQLVQKRDTGLTLLGRSLNLRSERVKAAAKGVLAKCGLAWVRKDRK